MTEKKRRTQKRRNEGTKERRNEGRKEGKTERTNRRTLDKIESECVQTYT